MDLYHVLFNLELINEKVLDGNTLVALELQDIAVLGIFDNCTVSGEIFLPLFQDNFVVVLFGDSLDSCQGLSTISLLQSDVYIILGVVTFSTSLTNTGISKGVVAFEVFDGHKPDSEGVKDC